MNELDQAISKAFASEGKQEDVNKVYIILLRTALFIPVKKKDPELKPIREEEPFSPLFTKINDNYFMIAFNRLDRLHAWAGEHFTEMSYVELSGRDLILGINEQSYLSLNLETPYHKEFSPDEVKRLKIIVSKIDRLKTS